MVKGVLFLQGFLTALVYKVIYYNKLQGYSHRVFYRGLISINQGLLKFDGGFRARGRCHINITNGQVDIGNNVYFNYNVILTCRKKISIGDNTMFGPGVMVFDHDHLVPIEHFGRDQYVLSEVSIGKNVWIGAGSIILKGVTIGDNAVIASGSIVTKDIPPGHTLVQKRINSEYKHKI